MRQTLFFSATMMPEIRRLADAFLINPKEISVAPPASPAEMVEQSVLWTDARSKREALRLLIKRENVKNALIFCNRKSDVDILNRSLQKYGLDAAALHGDMAQEVRTETLERFKRGEVRLLVCSDVAARGLDIQFMSHVFNFDVPHHAEAYVHRIGRTGRAGRRGRAITLATPDESKAVAAIEHLIKRQISRESLPELAEVAPMAAREDARPQRHRGRRREHVVREPAAPAPSLVAESQAAPGVAEAAHPAPATADLPTPAPTAPTLRPEPRREPGRGPRHRHEREEPDERVVGMGDHVPAFLMRSMRLGSR